MQIDESFKNSPASSVLADEVREWNNHMVGAYTLWRFTNGYCDAHPDCEAPIGLLHFIASGVLATPRLRESISQRRSGLESYSRGFEIDHRVDLLLSIQQKIAERRLYTLRSIDAAISHQLLAWDFESGKIYPLYPETNKKLKKPRASVVREGDKAELLGKWFAPHTLSSIASYLRLSL